MSSPFDDDPAALEWARGRVLAVTTLWRARAADLARHGMGDNAAKWLAIAQLTENEMIGGVTGTFGAFDVRWAGGGPAAVDDGPAAGHAAGVPGGTGRGEPGGPGGIPAGNGT